jgi:uncharacterized protein
MTLRIGTSEPGGTFHTQGEAIARILEQDGTEVTVHTAITASVGNAISLDEDALDFGCMASNWIGRARSGTPPFADSIDLRMVAPLNAGPLFFVTLAGSPLSDISELKGKRIAVGLEHSGMAQHVRVIFDALDMSFDDIEPVWLGFADGADALIAGQVDVQFQCPIPNVVMTDLSQRADIAVAPITDSQISRLLNAVPYYRRVTMPAGALRGLQADCNQIGVLNVLVTHARADRDMVQYVAHSLCEKALELEAINPLFRGLSTLFEPLQQDGAEAMEHGGVELHDGAIAAYREAGYLD